MVIRSRTTRPLRMPDSARNEGKNRDKKNEVHALVAPLTILTVIVAMCRLFLNPHMPPNFPTMPENAVRIDENVGLSLKFSKARGGKNVTLGPHEASLVIAKRCKEPRFVLRLVGDEALYSIPIVQKDKYRWECSFQIPFPGLYVVEPRWYGCDPAKQPKNPIRESTKISVSGDRDVANNRLSPSYTTLPDLIPEGFWAAPKLHAEMPNKRFWITPGMDADETTFITSSTELGASMVAREATPVTSMFGDLSNYELLCWIGSTSAATIWESFKSIRPSIAKHQKPFKFHYYPMDDFRQPDRDWETETKLKFRKCKIIVVSVDELKYPITQDDYKQQVATFLRHLVKMFDDETFPIWMLTVNLPSISNPLNMCTAPKRRTNHHPCNDALFDMFSAKAFPPHRVRLLDNTDLTDALLEEEGLQDAVAVIAMRIFAIAGQQVKEWRRAKQRGIKEGLQRRGKLEPNIEFTVYNFKS
jgi:hypothetical protein